MSSLLERLAEDIRALESDQKAALLLSGGLDSVSVGLAMQKAGRTVHAYTFHLEGGPTQEVERALRIASHYGWSHTGIEIPTRTMADDFIRLSVTHRCRRKVEFEVLYPLLYALPTITETEIYTGWNADYYFGNGREDLLRRNRLVSEGLSRADRKSVFDMERNEALDKLAAPSGETWSSAKELAAHFGKDLQAPYLGSSVRDYFLQFDQDDLASPRKPLVRQALSEQLAGLPKGSIGPRLPMQIGGGVSDQFARLVDDPRINRFERRYRSVSAICQRWNREVASDPHRYRAIVRSLGRAAVAHTVDYPTARYVPYRMADIRQSEASRRMTGVSMFAGGGGSCIGLASAGVHVVLANEFVPEAARTYTKNFPGTFVDTRDIRSICVSREAVEEFLGQAGLKPGDPDIVCGSPPCSEFSLLGGGIAESETKKRYSDTEQSNIAGLLFDFVRFNRAALPKAIIAENVPPLGNTFRPLLESALDQLRFTSEGGERLYFATDRILCADHYGVPQSRRRLILVAVRSDVAQAVGITSDEDLARVFPPPTSPPINIRDALSGLQQSPDQIRPWVESMIGTPLYDYVSKLPRDPPHVLKLKDVGIDIDSHFTLARTSWRLPSPTLTVMGQRPDGLSGLIHPGKDRKFTIPELKRLTGLPEDYALTGSVAQGAERICRMVPPFMIKAVVDRLYERILQPYGDRND